jgi:hypothetical protein
MATGVLIEARIHKTGAKLIRKAPFVPHQDAIIYFIFIWEAQPLLGANITVALVYIASLILELLRKFLC